jgi:hypothetical protein
MYCAAELIGVVGASCTRQLPIGFDALALFCLQRSGFQALRPFIKIRSHIRSVSSSRASTEAFPDAPTI